MYSVFLREPEHSLRRRKTRGQADQAWSDQA